MNGQWSHEDHNACMQFFAFILYKIIFNGIYYWINAEFK